MTRPRHQARDKHGKEVAGVGVCRWHKCLWNWRQATEKPSGTVRRWESRLEKCNAKPTAAWYINNRKPSGRRDPIYKSHRNTTPGNILKEMCRIRQGTPFHSAEWQTHTPDGDSSPQMPLGPLFLYAQYSYHKQLRWSFWNLPSPQNNSKVQLEEQSHEYN